MKKLTGPILLMGTPVEASNLRYASGFSAPDPVVFLQHGKRKYLVVSLLEVGRAKRTTSGIQILTPQELCSNAHQRRTLSSWALALLQRENLRNVVVSDMFPLGVARKLEQAGINVSISSKNLFPQREIKSALEIEKMRQVQQVGVKALQQAIECIQHSTVDASGYLRRGRRRLTSEEVREKIEVTLLHEQCQTTETIVAGGGQGADPHEKGSGFLQAGQPIVIDIFPQHKEHGYWGDITRTVIKGPISDEQRKMYHAVLQAQISALRKVKPGVSCGTIHREVVRIFKEKGYITKFQDGKAEGFIHGTGHGIGLDIHEPPSIRSGATKLRKGHVITVEPGLYYYDHGGIRIEDTIVVTAEGWEYLAPCAKHLDV